MYGICDMYKRTLILLLSILVLLIGVVQAQDPPLAVIVIEKNAPDAGNTFFYFNGDLSGYLPHGGQIKEYGAIPGTHRITEAQTPEWELNSVHCKALVGNPPNVDAVYDEKLVFLGVDIHLEEGQTVKCTFYNIRVNTPPSCENAYLSVDVLWPPNHQLIPFEILGVTDPDDDTVSTYVDNVLQDEPVNGLFDGDKSPDAVGQTLRAERDGDGNGRVYKVRFTAYDDYGSACTGELLATVPLSRGVNGTAVDDGTIFDSTAP